MENAPDIKGAVWSALCSLATAPLEQRTLTGLSVNAVSPALIRARQKIRALLGGEG